MTFHDGRPLTTSDVQFTLDAVRDPGARASITCGRCSTTSRRSSSSRSHELRLRLKRPSGWVLRALAEIPILPMHVYDGSLSAAARSSAPGRGSWSSNKGGVVHLTRNDKYWGGKPAIADLEFVYQPDAAVALSAAKRGELDIVPGADPGALARAGERARHRRVVRAARARAAAPALPRVQRRARRRSTTSRAPRARAARRSPRDRQARVRRPRAAGAVADLAGRPGRRPRGRRCPTSIPAPPASCSTPPAGSTATRTASATRAASSCGS